jgi:hypothetical protein
MLLFNWFGYRVYISFAEDNAVTQLETQLDKNDYDESRLVSVKIPVTYLPYYSNSKYFERVDGQIEIEGIQYNYVKRRIYNDSLEILCIPNHTTMKLQVAKNEFFKFANDLQQHKKPSSHSGSSKNLGIDYYAVNNSFNTNILLINSQIPSHYSARLTSCYSPTAEQPPDIY